MRAAFGDLRHTAHGAPRRTAAPSHLWGETQAATKHPHIPEPDPGAVMRRRPRGAGCDGTASSPKSVLVRTWAMLYFGGEGNARVLQGGVGACATIELSPYLRTWSAARHDPCDSGTARTLRKCKGPPVRRCVLCVYCRRKMGSRRRHVRGDGGEMAGTGGINITVLNDREWGLRHWLPHHDSPSLTNTREGVGSGRGPVAASGKRHCVLPSLTAAQRHARRLAATHARHDGADAAHLDASDVRVCM